MGLHLVVAAALLAGSCGGLPTRPTSIDEDHQESSASDCHLSYFNYVFINHEPGHWLWGADFSAACFPPGNRRIDVYIKSRLWYPDGGIAASDAYHVRLREGVDTAASGVCGYDLCHLYSDRYVPGLHTHAFTYEWCVDSNVPCRPDWPTRQ